MNEIKSFEKKCDYCNRTYFDEERFKEHQQVDHRQQTERIYKCIQCNNRYFHRYEIDRHMYRVHGNNRNGERQFFAESNDHSTSFSRNITLNIKRECPDPEQTNEYWE